MQHGFCHSKYNEFYLHVIEACTGIIQESFNVPNLSRKYTKEEKHI